MDKLLWVLIGVCLVINGLLISTDRLLLSRYQELEDLCGPITEQSLLLMEETYEQELNQAKALYKDRYGEETKDIDTLYARGCLGDEDHFNSMALQYQMIAYGKAVLSGEYTFNLDAFAKSRGTHFVGQVLRAQQRDELVRKDEEAAWFTAAQFTTMRQGLYGKLIPAFFIEMVVISAFLILKSLESEFAFGTAATVYSTHAGREAIFIKLLAVLCAISSLYVALSGLSLTAFFVVHPQNSTLSAPVTAQVYPEQLPKIGATGLEYLIASLTVGYAVVLVFASLSAALGLFYQANSFFGAIGMGAIVGIMTLAQSLCDGRMNLPNLILAGNPMAFFVKFKEGRLQFRTGEWFLYTTDCYSAPYFECIVLIIWLVIAGLLLYVAWRTFQRRELP